MFTFLITENYLDFIYILVQFEEKLEISHTFSKILAIKKDNN